MEEGVGIGGEVGINGKGSGEEVEGREKEEVENVGESGKCVKRGIPDGILVTSMSNGYLSCNLHVSNISIIGWHFRMSAHWTLEV